MFLSYIVNNFALLCTAVAMIFIIIYNARGQKRENFYSFLIIGTALLLSVFSAIEQWGKTQVDHPLIATIFAGLGYIIRPICVYFFIVLVGKKVKYQWIFYIPLIFNAIVYSMSFFINVEFLQKFAFYFTVNEQGTELDFNRGYMNFTSHIVAGLYMLYFLFMAFRMLNGKHKTESLVLFVCAACVCAAVTLESLEIATNLLNVTIAISCLFYYLYPFLFFSFTCYLIIVIFF